MASKFLTSITGILILRLVLDNNPSLCQRKKIGNVVTAQDTRNDVRHHVVLHGVLNVIAPGLQCAGECGTSQSLVEHSSVHHYDCVHSVSLDCNLAALQLFVSRTEIENGAQILHTLTYERFACMQGCYCRTILSIPILGKVVLENVARLTKTSQVGIDMNRAVGECITTIGLYQQTCLSCISKMDANLRLLIGNRRNPDDDRNRILTFAIELITIFLHVALRFVASLNSIPMIVQSRKSQQLQNASLHLVGRLRTESLALG